MITILITRPEPSAMRFAEALGPLDARIVVAPLQRIVPVRAEPLPGQVAGVVLTSANGLIGLEDTNIPAGTRAWCVGAATADAAADAGLDAVSADGSAVDLEATILKERPDGVLVHLRGEHAAMDLAGSLRAAGLQCQERVVYRQEAMPISEEGRGVLLGPGTVLAPLFSPRSARLLGSAASLTAPISVVAISPAVAEAARVFEPISIRIAEAPDAESMIEATRAALTALSPL